MVKIAVSSVTPGGLDVLIDHRFGRCEFFTIIEISGKEITKVTSINNPAVNESGGAGILAAQTIANNDCNIVITGRLGPNAFDSLNRLNIGTYMAPIGDTVRKVIEDYLKGRLVTFNNPTAPSKSGVISEENNSQISQNYKRGFGQGYGHRKGR